MRTLAEVGISMRNRLFLFQALAVVVLSFVITWVLVFHTKLLDFVGAGWTDYEYRDVGGFMDAGSFDLSPTRQLRELEKLQPEEFQSVTKELFDDLMEKSTAELYMLKAAGENVCLLPLISCRGVPGKHVAPFADMALAYRQAQETVAVSAWGSFLSRVSLVISLGSFLATFGGFVLNYRQQRRSQSRG